jgi:hypothetical protein
MEELKEILLLKEINSVEYFVKEIEISPKLRKINQLVIIKNQG